MSPPTHKRPQGAEQHKIQVTVTPLIASENNTLFYYLWTIHNVFPNILGQTLSDFKAVPY